MNKPKPGAAWSITLAAALDLFAFVLLANVDASSRMLLIFGACELVLIVAATGMWQQYFEQLIDFKMKGTRVDNEGSSGEAPDPGA